MNKSFSGEYDNYNYHSAEEMSLSEQIESAKKALASAIRLSRINESDYWDKKIIEIKQRIQQLEIVSNS
jgi:hypothetical protein